MSESMQLHSEHHNLDFPPFSSLSLSINCIHSFISFDALTFCVSGFIKHGY